MPRFPSFPTLYDEVLQIHLSNLKKWGYLKPGQLKGGKLYWTRNGQTTGSIGIMANTISERPFVELDYKYNDEPRQYKVYLVSIPSNLGKGRVWYFQCPKTGKRCRKLYSIGGYFLHREAFTGCMYESQTQSKYYRWLEKNFGPRLRLDRLYQKLYSKHFKKYYAGKPTKRYLNIKREIDKAEQIPLDRYEWLLVTGR